MIVLSVLFYRPFCKWLCPLGAFYALFNRVSLFQMKVDKIQVRILREMRQSLQDGRGCDEDAQPYRVHPLRNVHTRLSDERRVLPLRLRRR